jgi:hypothetical protein
MQQVPPARQAAGVDEAPRSPELPPMQRRDAASTPPQQQERPAHSVERRTTRPASRANQPGSDDDDDDYGYGVSSEWLKKVRAVEAATKARQQQEKQQGQLQQMLPAQPDQWDDIEMEDVSTEAVLAAVSQLRGDQEYLDELHRAIDMDWEPVPAGPSDERPAAAAAGIGADDCSAVNLASTAGSLLHERQQQPVGEGALLVLVLDTNVLVGKKQTLMRCLHQLQDLQQQQQHAGRIVLQLLQGSAHAQGAGGHSSSGGGSAVEGHTPAAAAVQVQVVVPWTVLVELDKLKLRKCPHETAVDPTAAALTPNNRLIPCMWLVKRVC